MSYPPDWLPEPREHDDRCLMLCEHADIQREMSTDEELVCGHFMHMCTCDELHEQDAEREAEAYAEYLYEREP